MAERKTNIIHFGKGASMQTFNYTFTWEGVMGSDNDSTSYVYVSRQGGDPMQFDVRSAVELYNILGLVLGRITPE